MDLTGPRSIKARNGPLSRAALATAQAPVVPYERDKKRIFISMTVPKPDLSDLTDLQLLILGVLWKSLEATIGDISGAIGERTRTSTKTVATILGRMEKRGLVARRVVGRENVYRPLVTRRKVLVSRVGATLASVFAVDDGVPGTAAVSRKEVDADDADRLIDLLKRAERDVRRK